MERIRLDKHALKVELPEQLLEHGALVILSSGVTGLSDRHTQGCRVQRHLGDERRTATTGGLNRAPESLAVTDQLIEITCPTWDLGDGPIPDSGADGSHVHLQEEVAEGGIGGRTLELKAKGLVQHGVVASGKTLQIAQALAFAQDPEHGHQQQVPSRDAHTAPHPGIRDRLEVADQIEIGCGRNALGH